jgi:transposase
MAKTTQATRGRYALKFKKEAVRLAESGQSQAEAARSLGAVDQAVGNWVKAHRAGTLKGAIGRPLVSCAQMENRRLCTELARVTMKRDILGKATASFAKGQHGAISERFVIKRSSVSTFFEQGRNAFSVDTRTILHLDLY